jgi:hypothetical protein
LIRLNTNPVVDIIDKIHCQRAGLLTLDNLAKLPSSKIGGIQTFRCIDGPLLNVIAPANTLPITYTFDPGLETEPDRTGKYTIEYCFADAITGCKTCDTSFITVIKLPEIQFNSLPLLCINDSLLTLDSFVIDRNTQQRLNGDWSTIEYNRTRTPNDKISKSIVNKKYFNPIYGPGIFMVKISDVSSGCLVEDSVELTVNGSSSGYSYHNFRGTGSTVTAGGAGSLDRTYPALSLCSSGSGFTNIFGAGIIDILDYANTNKYKTIRTLFGVDGDSNRIGLSSGSWQNTAAITSISLKDQNGGNFVQYTSVALYGIKGA